MKNCIIISNSYNVGATGTVVKDIANGFIKNNHKPLLITHNIKKGETQLVNLLLIKKTKKKFFLSPEQIDKVKIILFRPLIKLSSTIKDLQIVKKFINVQSTENPPIFILVIVSGEVNIRFLRLGHKLAKLYKIPFILHNIDPLPSPPGWGEKNIYRRAVKKAITPYYEKANFITASNPQMLTYQLNELKFENKKNFVLYNPTGIFKELSKLKIRKNTFLYLGSLYGKRDAKTLINEFLTLLDVVLDAKLILVGSAIDLSNHEIPTEKIKNFEVVGWSDNPEKYIEAAEILLDYNANINEDVFLSSKLTKYISYNRKVLILSAGKSAPEQFIANKENLGIWNTTFSENNFVQNATDSLNTEISNWSERSKFCKSINSDIQVAKFIDFLSKENI